MRWVGSLLLEPQSEVSIRTNYMSGEGTFEGHETGVCKPSITVLVSC